MEKEEQFMETLLQNLNGRTQHFPAKETCMQFVEELFSFLFLCDVAETSKRIKLWKHYVKLKTDFETILNDIFGDAAVSKAALDKVFGALPAIYKELIQDAKAINDADPAAHNIDEVLVAYPGFFAIFVYRISHQLYVQELYTLARIFSEYAHSKTGIDIHPGAGIGHAFAIDHGTGIVIGETTKIGNQVKLYQGVTLGALNVSKDKAAIKRHPTIEDSVIIYAGATILGGETVIGKESIIGGNVWLTYSVPANSVVYHKSEIHVKDNNPFPEPLNFVI